MCVFAIAQHVIYSTSNGIKSEISMENVYLNRHIFFSLWNVALFVVQFSVIVTSLKNLSMKIVTSLKIPARFERRIWSNRFNVDSRQIRLFGEKKINENVRNVIWFLTNASECFELFTSLNHSWKFRSKIHVRCSVTIDQDTHINGQIIQRCVFKCNRHFNVLIYHRNCFFFLLK